MDSGDDDDFFALLLLVLHHLAIKIERWICGRVTSRQKKSPILFWKFPAVSVNRLFFSIHIEQAISKIADCTLVKEFFWVDPDRFQETHHCEAVGVNLTLRWFRAGRIKHA